jgi:molybdenum-dependent DNA-binding transcriptional regulator ModE
MRILSFTQHACFLSVNTCAQRREARGRKGGREGGSVGGREERERMIERARKGRKEIEMQAKRSRREERVLKKSTKERVRIEMQARRSRR